MSSELEEDAGIDERFWKQATSHEEYAEAYRRTIENLENQLDHARKMLDIHVYASKALREIGGVARERIAEHHSYLKRNEPAQAEAAPRKF